MPQKKSDRIPWTDDPLPNGEPAAKGQRQVRPHCSPWWDSMLATLSSREDLWGTMVTPDDLVALIPQDPNKPKTMRRAVVRRLAPMLELVSRGPNGSRSIGAIYRIVRPPTKPPSSADEIGTDDDFLAHAAARMTGGKIKGGHDD